MEKIRLKNLDEDIFYEKLDNGLEVYLYTKDTFQSNYVTFTTKYGSVYNEFVPITDKKMTAFPKGIAHFLEHKVFAVKDGPDPMEFFSKTGAICNAYTTFKNTTYLFYATDALKENINYLLDYVQELYLTDESVENEKNIISEEIHMYDDRPQEVLAERIRNNALIKSPYKDSIIGTVDDISKITKDDLEICYNTFYHPSNMFLVATGNFNPNELIEVIKDNQSKKDFIRSKKIVVQEFDEKDHVSKNEEIIECSTTIPKVALTIKLSLKNIKMNKKKLQLYLHILFSSMFDETSEFDERLKNEEIISNTTYISTLNCDTHILISIINETLKYQEFLNSVEDSLKNIKITKDNFERKKKVLKSNQIFAFEYVEEVNDMIIDDIIYNNKINDDPLGLIDSLDIKELTDLIKKIDTKNCSKIILKDK